MNDRDYHAMSHARAALMDGKNELIRCGSGSDETLRLMRAAEAALGRQMEGHEENMAAGAEEVPNAS
jgi:hypothetical protein